MHRPQTSARQSVTSRSCPGRKVRAAFEQGDAGSMRFGADSFDSAFLCWILEHVGDPLLVLSETRRVLRPGSPIICTEVLNATFFLEPYSPHTLKYWMAFNDHQLELGGDPFVGAKLGNLLQAVGCRDIVTTVRPIHLDNRAPGERAEFIAYWTDCSCRVPPVWSRRARFRSRPSKA
jgi:ubiquinone/menaquinone biosynthesis C-methylase UbiE